MKKMILASGSPRRKEILSRFNMDIEVVISNIKEKIRVGEEPKQTAMSLAYQKAQDVANNYKSNEIVLAADTIVYIKDTDKNNTNILGKPKNENEALEMLKLLNGKEHFVITGVAIIQAGTLKKVVDYTKTMVKFRQLSEEKIKSYIATGEYRDKAGSYGIQGIGSVLVDSFKGSYSNVVGLPVTKVDNLLEKHFGMKLL